VDIVPHTGAVVKRFHVDAWKQSIRLLARLEGLSTALAAPHLTRSDLEAARALNNQMAISLAELDAERFGCLNRQFHVLLCSRCDDQRLNDLVEHEWMRIDIVRRSVFWHAPGRAAASVAEHDVLLDLIESRADADVIEAAVRAHEVATLQAVLADEEKRGREIA
jgi:DNA-binding GntR family transcriptional regulator